VLLVNIHSSLLCGCSILKAKPTLEALSWVLQSCIHAGSSTQKPTPEASREQAQRTHRWRHMHTHAPSLNTNLLHCCRFLNDKPTLKASREQSATCVVGVFNA
jgi:hypothetical protein